MQLNEGKFKMETVSHSSNLENETHRELKTKMYVLRIVLKLRFDQFRTSD